MGDERTVVSVGRIQQNILLVRGQKVMLDRDLAVLYGVETRVLNQAVRRNKERFPPDFMFELTREEIMGISQSVISSDLRYSKRVAAFTQEGVAMLSGVLNSSRAVCVNIAIMRAFIRTRELLGTRKEFAEKLAALDKRVGSHDVAIRAVVEAIKKLAFSAGTAGGCSAPEPEKPRSALKSAKALRLTVGGGPKDDEEKSLMCPE